MEQIDDDLMEYALEQARTLGVTYADVKWMQRSSRLITVKNDTIENNSQSKNQGIGVKILVDGGYGFAATNQLSKSTLKSIAKRAYRVAKATGKTMKKKPVVLAEEPIHVDRVTTLP